MIARWLDKVLVPEWRKSLRMLSVRWNALCIASAPAWLALSEDQKNAVLSSIGVHPAWLVSAAFLIGILVRLKSQGIAEGAGK